MINAIPFIGWFLSLFVAVSMAIPFWIVYTAFGIGDKYFYWAPEVYRHPAFWDCVGLFIAISILKFVLIPKLASVSSESKTKDDAR